MRSEKLPHTPELSHAACINNLGPHFRGTDSGLAQWPHAYCGQAMLSELWHRDATKPAPSSDKCTQVKLSVQSTELILHKSCISACHLLHDAGPAHRHLGPALGRYEPLGCPDMLACCSVRTTHCTQMLSRRMAACMPFCHVVSHSICCCEPADGSREG